MTEIRSLQFPKEKGLREMQNSKAEARMFKESCGRRIEDAATESIGFHRPQGGFALKRQAQAPEQAREGLLIPLGRYQQCLGRGLTLRYG